MPQMGVAAGTYYVEGNPHVIDKRYIVTRAETSYEANATRKQTTIDAMPFSVTATFVKRTMDTNIKDKFTSVVFDKSFIIDKVSKILGK